MSMVTLLCGMYQLPVSKIVANQPDVVLHVKKEKTCLLINIAVPGDSNCNTQETEKLSLYEGLEVKVSRVWKVRTDILPVIIGALETFKRGLDQNLDLLPVHPSSIELQTTLKSNAHIILKSSGVNHFDLFLRSGLEDHHLITNRRE